MHITSNLGHVCFEISNPLRVAYGNYLRGYKDIKLRSAYLSWRAYEFIRHFANSQSTQIIIDKSIYLSQELDPFSNQVHYYYCIFNLKRHSKSLVYL